MASTSNQGPNPNRGRKRRRPSTAAVVAGTVGKVLGTFLLICVITGAILLCFAFRNPAVQLMGVLSGTLLKSASRHCIISLYIIRILTP